MLLPVVLKNITKFIDDQTLYLNLNIAEFIEDQTLNLNKNIAKFIERQTLYLNQNIAEFREAEFICPSRIVKKLVTDHLINQAMYEASEK